MLEPPSSTDEQAKIAQLEALLSERAAEIEARDRRIRLLEEALRLMRVEKYGASREKLGEVPGQRGLFNEAEAALEVIEAVGMEPELCATPLREDKAPAKSPGRKALPAHLPRIEVRHDLPADKRICGCGSPLEEFDVETSEQLDIIPAKIQVIRHAVGASATGRVTAPGTSSIEESDESLVTILMRIRHPRANHCPCVAPKSARSDMTHSFVRSRPRRHSTQTQVGLFPNFLYNSKR